MAINQLSLQESIGGAERDNRAVANNAMNLQLGQQRVDANDRQTELDELEVDREKFRWLAGASGYVIQNEGRGAAELLAEGKRRGYQGFESLTEEQMTPDVWQGINEQAMIGLGGNQVQDISQEDMPYAQRDPLTNEVSPTRTTGGRLPAAPIQEIEIINASRTAAGLEPMVGNEVESYLKNYRQNASPMQLYNQYVEDYRVNPQGQMMTEREFAATRIGEGTTAKKTAEEEVKKHYGMPQAYASHAQATQNFDRLSEAATSLAGDDALWKAVGLYQTLAAVPGQEGADIRARISNMKSQVGFMVLQDMRNASKTGGALGQVSEMENKLLQDNLASLDVNQSPEQFRENLLRISQYVFDSKARMDRAWELTYPELSTYGSPLDATMTPVPETNAVEQTTQIEVELNLAREAIANGIDVSWIHQQLQEKGINPDQL